MPVPAVIRDYLTRHGVEFTVIAPAVDRDALNAQIPLQQIAKTVFLKDEIGLLLAVFPASHGIDFEALQRRTGRRLATVAMRELRDALGGELETALLPLLGDECGFDLLIDEALLAANAIHFPAAGGALVRVGCDAFCGLNSSAQTSRFAEPVTDIADRDYSSSDARVYRLLHGVSIQEVEGAYVPVLDITSKIEKITELPAMPDMAYKLLQIKSDPDAEIRDLAKVVQLDPSLAAQVIRLSRSAYYGYRGEINSVEEAITQVLGFDMVLNTALGLAIGRAFRIPRDGELGLFAYWQHALYSAATAHLLARLMPAKQRPNLGMAYLCGLLHDFGFLLIGHLFPKEYYILRKVASAHADVPFTEIEAHVLGVGHNQIGAWLMDAWNMPAPVIDVVRHHHDEDYRGEHAVYVQLALLADHLLKRHGMGDAIDAELPQALLDALGLDRDEVLGAAEVLLGSSMELDSMARQMVA